MNFIICKYFVCNKLVMASVMRQEGLTSKTSERDVTRTKNIEFVSLYGKPCALVFLLTLFKPSSSTPSLMRRSPQLSSTPHIGGSLFRPNSLFWPVHMFWPGYLFWPLLWSFSGLCSHLDAVSGDMLAERGSEPAHLMEQRVRPKGLLFNLI